MFAFHFFFVLVDKMTAVLDVFASFASAATRQCRNSSRCVLVYNIDFDKSGLLAAMSVQVNSCDMSVAFPLPPDGSSLTIETK